MDGSTLSPLAMPSVVLFLLAVIAVSFSIRIVEHGSRGIIVRLGRILRVAPPGVHLITPGADRLLRVKVAEAVPDWRELSEQALDRRLLEMAETGELWRVGDKSCPTCGRPYEE